MPQKPLNTSEKYKIMAAIHYSVLHMIIY